MKKELLVRYEDLSLSNNENTFNEKQLTHLLKHTPTEYVRTRPAKGGGQWKYVTGGYVRKVLNHMFGWDWDFEILDEQILHDEAIVKGKLTIRSNGRTIIKTQYGNKDIAYKKATADGQRQPLSIGNDLKAAATDALKKCAAEIGIASDIYNAEEFQTINVVVSSEEDNKWIPLINGCKTEKDLMELFEANKEEIQKEKSLIALFSKRKSEINNG